ncbi:disulfide bond formation protein B [Sphingomonas sp. MMS24-JH45]
MDPGNQVRGDEGTWMTPALRRAQLLAFLVPAALLAGAWSFQLIGKLFPCEMCHWQRWPHYGALAFAALSFVAGGPRAKKTLVAGAAALVVVSGLIGVFHAGVEYHWWQADHRLHPDRFDRRPHHAAGARPSPRRADRALRSGAMGRSWA